MGMAHVVVLAAVLAMATTVSASPEAGVQPLSKIAIHKATVELHGSAYVRASALLLGDGDQQEGDTATVTVEYGWQNPATDDWIAVFSPSDFISGSCPNPRRYPTEPLLCTAPIKYQYANFSANYLYWGKGTIQFQLINQRSDFSFALFTGGLENPKLVGLTKLSPFKNPKAPVFPRLAQGKTHDEMAVTWTSGYDVGEAYPFVEWGMVTSGSGGGNPARTPAGTLTFNRGSMCGAPARTIGWRDPGFIHTAFMRGLWPNKEYFYKIGHELPDGTVVWGKPYTFRAPPTPGQSSLQRVIVFGDMGKAERDGSNEYANYQPGSLNTTDALVKDLDNFDMVFHIGDLPYANGYISQWDQFTAQVAPISARKPYMIASGNHERDWPNTGGFFDVEDSGGECGVLAETMYYYPAENRANFWYVQKIESYVSKLIRIVGNYRVSNELNDEMACERSQGTRWTTGCSGSAWRTRSTTGGRGRRSTSSSRSASPRWTGSTSRGSSSQRTGCWDTPPTSGTPSRAPSRSPRGGRACRSCGSGTASTWPSSATSTTTSAPARSTRTSA
ncbi:hypothetical protein VPH35_069191 [Triticum aestivum]